MSVSTRSTGGLSARIASAAEPLSATRHLGAPTFEERGQREHVAEVVVDDEDAAARERPVVEPVAISVRGVLTAAPMRRGRARGRSVGRVGVESVGVVTRARRAARREGIRQRQEDRERAAVAEAARQVDLAAEQPDELAADRETEPGAAVEPGRRAVALGEGLEDAALLQLLDADAGVVYRERDDRLRVDEGSGLGAPAFGGDAHLDVHAAVLGELERVRDEVLQDLAEPLRVGHDRRRDTSALDLDAEVETLRSGDVVELAHEIGVEQLERDVGQLDRSRFPTRPWPGRGCC